MQSGFIFTYGTLMSKFNNPIAQYLRENVLFIGQGYFKGLIFDLGNYPAAVYQSDIKRKVYGEVYQAKNISEIIKILDNYEGINDPNFNLYERKAVAININNKTIKAETYLYTKPYESLKLIKSGNYTQYLKMK